MATSDTTKSVKLRIVADAGTAQQTLEDIASKADSIDGKKSSLTVGVNSGTTSADLDAIKAKADALGITNVTFKVKADTSQANRALDDTKAKAATTGDSVGKSFLNATLGITGFGEAVTAASGESSTFARVLAGINLATGVLEPAMAGVVVAAGGLGAGFLSAGVGAGIFSTVAQAAVSQVSDAVKAETAAQNASGAAAVAASQKAQQAMAQLTPAQRQLATAIVNVQDEWQKFVQDNTSGVSQILTQGAGLLPGIFKDMGEFLPPVEAALSNIIRSLSTNLQSSSVQGFIQSLADNSGEALQKIAFAIGNVVKGIMGIVQAFMPMSQTLMSGLDTISAKFAEWGQTLTQHSGFQSLMQTFQTETPIAMNILKNLGQVILNVGKAMTGLSGVGNSKALLQVLEPLSSVIAKLSQNQDLDRIALYLLAAADAGKKLSSVFTGLSNGATAIKNISSGVSNFAKGFNDADQAANTATGVIGTFGGKMSTAVTAIKNWGIWSKVASAATKVWTGIQIAFDAVMDANPIALIIIGIVALVAIIVVIATKTKWFQDAWNASWGAIKAAFDAVFGWIKANWPLLLEILTGPIGIAVGMIVKYWSDISSAFETAWNAIVSFFSTIWSDITNSVTQGISDIVSFFAALPGRIVSALASLVTDLYNVGVNVINGLISGIENAVGALFSYIGNIASDISNVFSSVLSILSPSKVFESHGKNIVLGLVQGISGNAHLATSAVNSLANSVSGAMTTSSAAGTSSTGRGGAVTHNWTVNVSGVVGDAGATGKQIIQAANAYLRQTGQKQLAGA